MRPFGSPAGMSVGRGSVKQMQVCLNCPFFLALGGLRG